MKALLRLEDIGPGGYYGDGQSRQKLAAVGDMLHRLGVPFHAAIISRFVDPLRGVDCPLSATGVPAAAELAAHLHKWRDDGVSLGLHGYTHQYGRSISGEGFEFAYAGCRGDCPPDDSPQALGTTAGLANSYAYRRLALAFAEFRAVGLAPDWFETPHYAASPAQRRILEACTRFMYEDNPDAPGSRQVTARASANRYGRTWYVPTPLGYVDGTDPERDTARIVEEAARYAPDELASFFFHPFLEFPYIRIAVNGRTVYDERSPLRTLIAGLKAAGRQFVTIRAFSGS
ncbi:DUF2334 domain-containing protein [Paenibacillus athensensis]|uniref:DUF2334 domain-containing protein n=1 Tax=Paenibacillus athensensis TaxID=1967502 RepID=A0A4Y8PUH6_9BACL|nr:DUF2334 domain-containing protein [Paenibacillus athensensis]MCD1261751.1 DUF2334 domain-containing protein [Paenibacillus athensensis]